MKFVKKTKCRDWEFFIEKYGQRLKNKKWESLNKITSRETRNRVGSEAKKALHKHLWANQKGLCIYCLQAIRIRDFNMKSHIEHLYPKTKFTGLSFAFENLAASCNGFDCTAELEQKERDFCGHYKDRRDKKPSFDEIMFLNPFQVEHLENYFSFDIEGKIRANKQCSPEEQAKASYMIKLLDLNHPRLCVMRRDTYTSLVELELQEGIEEIEALLDSSNEFYLSFHPMMRQLFAV